MESKGSKGIKAKTVIELLTSLYKLLHQNKQDLVLQELSTKMRIESRSLTIQETLINNSFLISQDQALKMRLKFVRKKINKSQDHKTQLLTKKWLVFHLEI